MSHVQTTMSYGSVWLHFALEFRQPGPRLSSLALQTCFYCSAQAELAELVAARGASQPAPKASDVSNSELKLVPDLLYISRPLAKAADLPPTLQ